MGSFALRQTFCTVRLAGFDGELNEKVELNVYILRGQAYHRGVILRGGGGGSGAERN
jgi:hypothetical protein